MKRLFVLVVLLAPAMASGACPRSIAGSYVLSEETDNGDGTKEFTIGLITLNRASSSGAGTGTVTYDANGASGPNHESAEEDTRPLPLTYSYIPGSCRGRFVFASDDGELTKFFVVGENGGRILGIYSGTSPSAGSQINRFTLYKQ